MEPVKGVKRVLVDELPGGGLEAPYLKQVFVKRYIQTVDR